MTSKAERPVAFVTGASRGIGRAVALTLAERGYDVAGLATTYDPGPPKTGLAEVETEARKRGAAFLPLAGDLGCVEEHEAMLRRIEERFGRLDVLVNNAAVAPDKRRDVLEETPEAFDRVLSVNLRGTFFLTQRAARHMVKTKSEGRAKGRAVIVFISSVSAFMSSPNRAAYCMAKAALSHGTRIFAHRLADEGVCVFEVRPGIIETDMTRPVRALYDARIRDGLVPQGRWGRPEDVARVIAALCSGDFEFATGTVINVAGGLQIPRL